MATRLVSIVALAGLVPSGIARAESLAALAERIDRPRLGGEVQNPQPIRVGRAVITPHGTVHVLLAGEEPCGLYVAGPATFSYRIEDRFIRPIVERNLRRSSLKAAASPEALAITAGLDGALLWGWELAEGLEVAAAAAPQPPPAWAEPLLDRPLYALPHVGLILARRLAIRGVVHGLLHSRGFDLRLMVDPQNDRREILFEIKRLTKLDSQRYGGRNFARELAAQPIGRPWWEHDLAPLVAEHQSLRVDNDRGRHVTVTSTTRLRGRGAAGVWWAQLLEEVYEETREFPVRLVSVEVNGKPADYVFQGDLLLVALEPPLGEGQAAEVKVAHEGEYAIRYGGDSFWSLGSWPWYPTPPPNARLATMDLEVRVPEPLTPFVSGATLSSETKDGFTVVRSRLDQPMEYAVVAAGKYHVYRDRRLGIDATVATYVRPNEAGARRLLNNLFAAAECYQRYFNFPYPFSEVEVVEINEWGYAQAPPGVIFITQEAFNSLLEPTDRAFSQGVNARYLHEVAHAWWPHIAKRDSVEENWTSESFAEYASAVCLDALSQGNQSFRLKTALARWQGDIGDIGDGGSIYLAAYLSGANPEDFRDYRRLLYAKGPLVLHALRLELQRQAGRDEGERQFWIALRSYLKSFPFTWGGTAYLVAILDKVTGRPWQPWFERYVYGTEMPPLPD
jgi:hypothetical protein